MKKKILLGLLVAGTLTSSLFASTGIFGSGVELKINGNTILYALDNSGTTRLLPSGSSATLNQTSWANGSEASPVLNLGTFNPGAGNTLVLTGGSLLTFKNGASDVTGAFLDFRIFQVTPSGSFTEINLPFNENNVAGSGGDQRWALESGNINLLAGLPNGTYTLGVFLRDTNNNPNGGDFSSNGGANYGANFTVIPEPATFPAFAAPLLIAGFFLRRRRSTATSPA